MVYVLWFTSSEERALLFTHSVIGYAKWTCPVIRKVNDLMHVGSEACVFPNKSVF